MVLFDRKRNFSGPPLGGLAKNKSKSDHFKWFDVCPDATLNVSILAVSGSQGARCAADPVRPGRAARRYIARPEGPRGRESGRTHFLHSFDSQLCLPVIKREPRFRDPLLRLTIEIGFQSLRPTACDRTLQSRQVLHQPRRHPRPLRRCTA